MTYEIETRDGIVVRGIPDDVPPDHGSLKARVAKARAERDGVTGSFGENFVAGYGKAAPDIGLGLRQIAGFSSPAEADERKHLDAPLMDTWGGKLGNLAGNLMLAAPTLVLPGANTITGAGLMGALQGFLQPVGSDESRTRNTVTTGALGAGAQRVGRDIVDMLGTRATRQAAEAARAQSVNAARDTILENSRAAGYVVPPTQANPSVLNQILEGVSGKIKTGQVASQRNQAVTNQMAARALGLPEDEPITREVLTGLRQQAGQAYEAVRGLGKVPVDAEYRKAIVGLSSAYQGANKSFPGLAPDRVGALMDTLKVRSFDADSAVDAIRVLRETADEAFATRAKGLGNAARSAADALENVMERHAVAKGADPAIIDALRGARQTIARTYSVERALNEGGNVNARNLAAQLKSGVPLSDELRTAAQFASRFPKAAQNVDQVGSVPATSPLDWYAAIGTSLASGNPAPMALAGARPALRSMLLSGPYQRGMAQPNYAPPAVTRLADILLREGRVPDAMRLSLPPSYVANQ